LTTDRRAGRLFSLLATRTAAAAAKNATVKEAARKGKDVHENGINLQN